MCSTTTTAAYRSFGSRETTSITVAGPPVDAAIMITGNLPAPTAGGVPPFEGTTRGIGPLAATFASLESVAVRTTRTFAAIFNLRRSSSPTVRMSRSIPFTGFGTKSTAPNSSARRVLAVPSRDSELTITMGRGFCVMINSVACRPSSRGIFTSMVITSGCSDSARETPSRPSRAWPATSMLGSATMMSCRTLRMNAESSTISTRTFLLRAGIVAMLASGRRRVA